MIDKDLIRKASSKAFFDLKKHRFFTSKTEGPLTTLSLFGDHRQFFFDSERKIAWMKPVKKQTSFKICAAHKEWNNLFHFPTTMATNSVSEFVSEERRKTGIVKYEKSDSKQISIAGKIVARQVYKFDQNKLRSIFKTVLWKHLDREVATLALRAYGITADSLDYTIILNNKEEFVDTFNKAPAILPIWRAMMTSKVYNERKKDKVVMSLFDEELQFEARVNTLLLDYAEKGTTFVFPDIIKTVKQELSDGGLKAWKFLLKIPPLTVQSIYRQLNYKIPSFAIFVNWLSEVGMVPRYSLIKNLVNSLSMREKTEDLTALMRSALLRSSKMRGVKRFYNNEFSLVLDWFRNGGNRINNVRCHPVVLDHNQRKAPWSWFMRQQEEWHRETRERDLAKQKEGVENKAWESLVPEMTIKNHKVIPITTTYDLIEEGKEMHHCVGSYSSSCINGWSRIFSVRDSKNFKVATLELTRRAKSTVIGDSVHAESTSWTVSQCRGVCNAQVPEVITTIAKEVVKQYNKATLASPQEGLLPVKDEYGDDDFALAQEDLQEAV